MKLELILRWTILFLLYIWKSLGSPVGSMGKKLAQELLLMVEIRRSPVEVGSLTYFLQGFIHARWLFGISEPSTIWSTVSRVSPPISSKVAPIFVSLALPLVRTAVDTAIRWSSFFLVPATDRTTLGRVSLRRSHHSGRGLKPWKLTWNPKMEV